MLNITNQIIIFILVVISLFTLAHYVNAWEIANNYPFGKLCEVYNSCNY